MEIRNNPSFCGKIQYRKDLQGMNHLLTKKVKDTMRAAPRGTILHFEDGIGANLGKVEFYPDSLDRFDVTAVVERKNELTEQHVLDVIKAGREKFKKFKGRICIGCVGV